MSRSSDESLRGNEDGVLPSSDAAKVMDDLKKKLREQTNNEMEPDTFYQHYFMSHYSELPSGTSASVLRTMKRLSQFTEEDSDEAREKLPTSSDDNSSSTDSNILGKKLSFLVSKISEYPGGVESSSAQTIHFGTDGVDMQRPNVRDAFLSGYKRHIDKRLEDNTLKIGPAGDGASTSYDEVWIEQKKEELNQDALAEIEAYINALEVPPPSRSIGDLSDGSKSPPLIVEVVPPKKHHKGTKNRRKSHPTAVSKPRDKEQPIPVVHQSAPLYQQTIHGTSGVSRRPALLNLFRFAEKTDPPKKTFMQQIKSVLQVKPSQTPKPDRKVLSKDASAHLKAGSQKKYYHTLSSSSKRSTAITRVMDLFQRRPSVQVEPTAAEKRKARSEAQQQVIEAAKLRLRRAQSEEKRADAVAAGVQFHRTASLDSPSAASLFRRRQSSLRSDRSNLYYLFFKFHTCYDVTPTSAKMIVFDVLLTMSKAVEALFYNRVRSAPIWSDVEKEFIGILTVTDFINIVHSHRNDDGETEDFDEQRILDWRLQLEDALLPLVTISPDDSLYTAVEIMNSLKFHRLPVIDVSSGIITSIMTRKRIIKFLYEKTHNLVKPSYIYEKLKNINVCTTDVAVISEDTTIGDALAKFVEMRVSALPVVDTEGRLVDVYAKSDVISLAVDKKYKDLNMTWRQAKEGAGNEWCEGVNKCTMEDTFYDVMTRMSLEELHRLVVVDDDDKVVGILSLSDVLTYLVSPPKDGDGPSSVS